MNILLVFPSAQVAGWGTQGPSGNLDQNFMPMGISYIGTALKQAGHKVFPLDFRAISGWPHVETILRSGNWHRILIGCLSAEYNNALHFIELCKKHCPNVPIIFGGIHVTVSNTREIPGVSCILHGEADKDIIGAVEAPIPLIKCRPIEDLDSLPMLDRGLFSPFEYCTKFLPLLDPPFTSMMFGRGCPYGTPQMKGGKMEGCSYCYRSSQDQEFNKHRVRSPEHCIDEIVSEDICFGSSLGSFMCHDDIFPLSRSWVEEFIGEWDTRIEKRIRFWCQMRADQIIRFKDLMSELARIGLTWVSLGMESMYQPTLDFIGKGVTVEENWEAIRICKENKINLFLNYIRHLPGETEESVQATVSALEKIRPEYHAASTYTDMPGTIMNQYCRDNNLVTDEHYSLTRWPYEPKLKGIDYTGPIHQLWESALQHKSEPRNWED